MSSYVAIAHAATLASAAVALLAAAYHDMRRFRIPNIYCLILLLLFPAMALTAPESSSVNWIGNLIVFAIMLAIGMLLYRFKVIGGGDAKMIAAVSLWAGPPYVLHLLFFTTLAGGLLALLLGLLTYWRCLQAKNTDSRQSMKNLASTPIPYGIAIMIGGIVMLAHMAQTRLMTPSLATG